MSSGSGCWYEMFRKCSWNKKEEKKKSEGAKPDDKLDPV